MDRKKQRECLIKKIKVFEGFAGYGGASYGLKRLKENLPEFDYEVVGYSEIDKFASKLFDVNHNKLFEALMTKRLPNWRTLRKQLNDFIALPYKE